MHKRLEDIEAQLSMKDQRLGRPVARALRMLDLQASKSVLTALAQGQLADDWTLIQWAIDRSRDLEVEDDKIRKAIEQLRVGYTSSNGIPSVVFLRSLKRLCVQTKLITMSDWPEIITSDR